MSQSFRIDSAFTAPIRGSVPSGFGIQSHPVGWVQRVES